MAELQSTKIWGDLTVNVDITIGGRLVTGGQIDIPFSWTLRDKTYDRVVINTGWISGPQDYVLIKHPGNNTEADTVGIRIGDGYGFEYGKNDFDTNYLTVSYAGTFTVPDIYTSTDVTAANVFVDSNGRLVRSTASSLRVKENVRPIEIDTSLIYSLDLRTFEYKNNNLAGKTWHGLIAEEVDVILPEAADKDKKGRPDGINWNILTLSLLSEIKKLKTEVENFKRHK